MTPKHDPNETPTPGMVRHFEDGYAGPGDYFYSPWAGRVEHRPLTRVECDAGRCLVTGNPWGTDTRPAGKPCPCASCSARNAAVAEERVAAIDIVRQRGTT